MEVSVISILNNAYQFNLYIKGQPAHKGHNFMFNECHLYTSLTVFIC